jgi:hypothetical protein
LGSWVLCRNKSRRACLLSPRVGHSSRAAVATKRGGGKSNAFAPRLCRSDSTGFVNEGTRALSQGFSAVACVALVM